jgi:hypothetical protein
MYGSPPFNYGLFPQTWEDPATVEGGYGGDNDPLDIIEVGSGPLPIGTALKVKVRKDWVGWSALIIKLLPNDSCSRLTSSLFRFWVHCA